MTIKEIRDRHDAVRGYFADQKGHDAHMDRGYLLRQNELLIGRCEYDTEARDALCKELDQAEKRIEELEEFQRLVRTENDQLSDRIEELEAELHANQQSWQEHDQGRIFAAKEMQLRIEELEEAMRAGCEDMQKVLNNRLTFSSKCL
jgi:chromosome segregation ATPase